MNNNDENSEVFTNDTMHNPTEGFMLYWSHTKNSQIHDYLENAINLL